jgi:hypothetical protein
MDWLAASQELANRLGLTTMTHMTQEEVPELRPQEPPLLARVEGGLGWPNE